MALAPPQISNINNFDNLATTASTGVKARGGDYHANTSAAERRASTARCQNSELLFKLMFPEILAWKYLWRLCDKVVYYLCAHCIRLRCNM